MFSKVIFVTVFIASTYGFQTRTDGTTGPLDNVKSTPEGVKSTTEKQEIEAFEGQIEDKSLETADTSLETADTSLDTEDTSLDTEDTELEEEDTSQMGYTEIPNYEVKAAYERMEYALEKKPKDMRLFIAVVRNLFKNPDEAAGIQMYLMNRAFGKYCKQATTTTFIHNFWKDGCTGMFVMPNFSGYRSEFKKIFEDFEHDEINAEGAWSRITEICKNELSSHRNSLGYDDYRLREGELDQLENKLQKLERLQKLTELIPKMYPNADIQ